MVVYVWLMGLVWGVEKWHAQFFRPFYVLTMNPSWVKNVLRSSSDKDSLYSIYALLLALHELSIRASGLSGIKVKEGKKARSKENECKNLYSRKMVQTSNKEQTFCRTFSLDTHINGDALHFHRLSRCWYVLGKKAIEFEVVFVPFHRIKCLSLQIKFTSKNEGRCPICHREWYI